LIFEGRRNGNDIFSLQKKIVLPKWNLPSFSTLLFQDGGNIVEDEFPEFSFEVEAVSIEQIAVLVFLEKKNVTSSRCRALQS
jgi:hypothetical protein